MSIPQSFCLAFDLNANCATACRNYDHFRADCAEEFRHRSKPIDVQHFSGTSMSCNVLWERSHAPDPTGLPIVKELR
jgi:hypothetical protein